MSENQFYPFEAHWLFRGGIIQTILGSQFPGNIKLHPRKTHKIRLGARAWTLVRELEAQKPHSPIVLLAHGMGGCSESGYMLRIADKIWNRGAGVFMMNHRGSGPGMGLSDTLWNGGSSDDLHSVLQYILKLYPRRSILIVGFSLSGNVLLKYLGEGRKIPQNVHGAFAVNPPIDLKVSSRMLSVENGTRVFNRHYMKMIRHQTQAIAECFPGAFQPASECKTIWDFDAAYTAPAAGFKSVEEYYSKCSAGQFIESIEVPTTMVCSRDDPFVPPAVFDGIRMKLTVNFYAPDRGGHMGYISRRPTPLGDHRWLDYVILKWVENII